MEDLKRTILEREPKPESVKKEIARRVEEKIQREGVFLKKYDEVLNTYILNIFRKATDEISGSHDHRAIKIIGGEVIHLRLDSLHGQADGIKVFFGQDEMLMYLWFSPDPHSEKIVFKMFYGGEERTEHYALEAITKEFLTELICKNLILINKASLN
jgi:hypothetical protein